MTAKAPARILGVFSLVMINVIAVDSLRTLSFAAIFGLSLVFYYVIAGICFFIPTALVTAELATAWPRQGGIYAWVEEAFGAKWGLFTVWLQWVYNIVWYPTILVFILNLLGDIFKRPVFAKEIAGLQSLVPHLNLTDFASSPAFVAGCVTVLFMLLTLLNARGMALSALVSTVCSLVGTLLPMMLITLAGFMWWYLGYPVNVDFSFHHLLPQLNQLSDLSVFSVILFGLVGLEMSAVHAQEVKDPSRDYPRALMISVGVILVSLAASSLAVAMILTPEELQAGIIIAPVLALNKFLGQVLGQQAAQYAWLAELPFMLGAAAVIVGTLGMVAAWIIGPSKGLLAAATQGQLPKWFAKTDRSGVPVNILILQCVIVACLSLVYVLMPSVNAAYFILTELTATMALLMYLMFFSSYLVLHFKKAETNRPFRIPGGAVGASITACLGICSAFLVMAFSFMLPTQVQGISAEHYALLMLVGLILLCSPPLFLCRFYRA